MKNFKSIKTIAKSKNVHIKELAEKLNISPVTVSRWVIGASSPSYENLRKVCEILGVSATEILGF